MLCLITGATDGIGRHTAFKLALSSPKNTVVIHGRNAGRLSQTVSDIQKRSRNKCVESVAADFCSLDEIREMSCQIHRRYSHIDLLINNAGHFDYTRRETKDGNEVTFQVNVLAPFLLTYLLLDLLKKSSNPRIINVSSLSQCSHFDLDTIQQQSGHSAYEISKVSMCIFTFELATQFPWLCSSCLDPGTVNTKMLLEGWGPYGIDVTTADDEFWLANQIRSNIGGKYFVGRRESRASSMSYDEASRRRLWAMLENLCGIKHLSLGSLLGFAQ